DRGGQGRHGAMLSYEKVNRFTYRNAGVVRPSRRRETVSARALRPRAGPPATSPEIRGVTADAVHSRAVRHRKRPAVGVSVRDVAAAAGVSVGTVSNVLNRPGKVAASTVARVHAAIDELGFIRNDAARQLRAGRSRSLGLVVLDIRNP